MILGLDGKTALATGAAGDIGRAIALAKAGADLALHDLTEDEASLYFGQALSPNGGGAMA